MNPAHDPRCETSAPDAIWLELSFEGRAYAFGLPADETRAITVGSLQRADLRIDRPGVAPVQFHIERENGRLWIVPAYGPAGLRVDTARVAGPRRIDSGAIIEFCDVRIEATVLDAPPIPSKRSSLARLRQGGFTERASQAARQGLGGGELGVRVSDRPGPTMRDMTPPTLSMDRLASPSPVAVEQPTTRLSPMRVPSADLLQRTVVIEHVRVVPITDITLRTREAATERPRANPPIELPSEVGADTVETKPFWFDEYESEVRPTENSPSLSHDKPRPEDSSQQSGTNAGAIARIVPVAIQALGAVRATSEARSVALTRGDNTNVSPTKPTSQVPYCPALPEETDSQQTTYFEPIRISQAPIAGGVQGSERLVNPSGQVLEHGEQPLMVAQWLSEVGRFSIRRPLLVWIAGTMTVFAVSAAIAKLSTSERPTFHAAHSPAGAATKRDGSPAPVASMAGSPLRPDPPALVIIPAESAPSSVKAKKGQAVHPELVAAVGALMSGHYADAQAAYAKLSAAAPSDRALHAVSALLAKKLAPQCSTVTPSKGVTCPEVKP